MKRIFALGLSLLMLLFLTACQQTADSNRTEQSGAAQSADSIQDPADASAAADPADSSLLSIGELSDSGAVSSSPAPSQPEPEEQRAPRTFGCSMPADATLTEAAVAEELRAYLEGIGDSLILAEPAPDAEAQKNQLKELSGQKVDAIFVCPVDGAGLEDALQTLSDQDLPVFGFGEWDAAPNGVVAIIRSDEYNAGYVCGIDLAERCPNGGDVLVLEQTFSGAMMERAQGFMDAAEESGVELVIADELEANGDPDAAAKLVKDALKENPGLVAIFSTSDADAAGALQAVNNSNCLVYSADGSPELKAQLGKSQLAGLGAQSPMGIAQALADSANQHLDGEAVPEEDTVGTFLITAENGKQYGTDCWQ